ncbi:MAG: hypothetical protein QXL69_01345 [Candidatus Bathyarchaeia archaeon]
MCFSGCPNSCGHHAIADIGLQAVKLENGDPIPAYNIYLGGKAKVSKLFLKAVPADEVKLKLEDIIKAYLNSQDEFKSFRDFAESLLVRGKLE